MMRSKLVLLIAVILVLSAGVVVGRLWTRWPMVTGASGAQPSWLADQLDLSAEQRQQMDAIWADVNPKIDQNWERHRSLDHERDRAIQDLLTPEQWTAYGKIFDEFRARQTELHNEREKLVHDAEARSRALLNDSQRQKLDAMRDAMKNSHMRHGPRGPGSRASTRPAGAGQDGHRD
jgi:Spy/CpxP family protein refolding chaperone